MSREDDHELVDAFNTLFGGLKRDIEREKRKEQQKRESQARRDRDAVIQSQLYENSKRWR